MLKLSQAIAIFQLTRPTKGPRESADFVTKVTEISTHAAHEGAAEGIIADWAGMEISTHAAHEGAALFRGRKFP